MYEYMIYTNCIYYYLTGELIAEPVSVFSILGFCLVAAGVVICVAVLLSYKHKQLMVTLTAQAQSVRSRAASFTSSIKSRTNSLRTSVRSKLSHRSSTSSTGDVTINTPRGR